MAQRKWSSGSMVEPNDVAAAPGLAPRRREPGTRAPMGVTMIGRGVVIEGEVRGSEDIEIEGEFEGTIELGQHVVTVGPRGRVRAQVLAKSVVVFGSSTGYITASEKVRIDATGSVEGEVSAPRVEDCGRCAFSGAGRHVAPRRYRRLSPTSLMGSLTRISESPACAATTNVGRVVVAVPAGFDHGDVGRVDEDVAVAVVALELHQGWNIKRLRGTRGSRRRKHSLTTWAFRRRRSTRSRAASCSSRTIPRTRRGGWRRPRSRRCTSSCTRAAGSSDGRHRARGGGEMSGSRLLGAHLPAMNPARRETVAGECLGCRAQFAVDVRLPLPATCPDCGADVLARADIEGPAAQRQPRSVRDRAGRRRQLPRGGDDGRG